MNDSPRTFMSLVILALLAAAACVVLIIFRADPGTFFAAYLVGYLFLLGLSLGSLCLLMLHNLTGGDWGYQIYPVAHAAAGTLPLFILLFIPIAIGMPWL